jgi:hypothetical protein
MTTCIVAMGGGGGAFLLVRRSHFLPASLQSRSASGCGRPARCRKAPMSLLGRRTIPVLQRRKEPTCLEEKGRRLHDARCFRLGFISWLGRGSDTGANACCPNVTRIALWLASNASPRETANGAPAVNTDRSKNTLYFLEFARRYKVHRSGKIDPTSRKQPPGLTACLFVPPRHNMLSGFKISLNIGGLAPAGDLSRKHVVAGRPKEVAAFREVVGSASPNTASQFDGSAVGVPSQTVTTRARSPRRRPDLPKPPNRFSRRRTARRAC